MFYPGKKSVQNTVYFNIFLQINSNRSNKTVDIYQRRGRLALLASDVGVTVISNSAELKIVRLLLVRRFRAAFSPR